MHITYEWPPAGRCYVRAFPEDGGQIIRWCLYSLPDRNLIEMLRVAAGTQVIFQGVELVSPADEDGLMPLPTWQR